MSAARPSTQRLCQGQDPHAPPRASRRGHRLLRGLVPHWDSDGPVFPLLLLPHCGYHGSSRLCGNRSGQSCVSQMNASSAGLAPGGPGPQATRDRSAEVGGGGRARKTQGHPTAAMCGGVRVQETQRTWSGPAVGLAVSFSCPVPGAGQGPQGAWDTQVCGGEARAPAAPGEQARADGQGAPEGPTQQCCVALTLCPPCACRKYLRDADRQVLAQRAFILTVKVLEDSLSELAEVPLYPPLPSPPGVPVLHSLLVPSYLRVSAWEWHLLPPWMGVSAGASTRGRWGLVVREGHSDILQAAVPTAPCPSPEPC